jgi:hypothetical protein
MAMILAVGGEFNNLALDLDSFNGTWLRAYASGYPNPKGGTYYWCNQMWSYYGHWWAKYLPAQVSEMYVSFDFAASTSNWSGINATIFCWKSGGNNVGTLQWEGAGSYKLYTGNNATLVGQTAANWNVAANTWLTLELHIKIHASQGLLELRINGVDALSWSGNTAVGGTLLDQISAWNGSTGNSQTLYWDNLVINDKTGARNNSWVGGAKVVWIRPTGAGTTTQLTPSSGNNFACVNENPPTMANFCSGAADGLLDTYALGDLAGGISRINAIRVDNLVIRQGLGPPRSIKPALRTGGQNIIAPVAQITPLSLGAICSNIWEINPVTGLPWTVADINALEAGGQVAT